MWGLDKEWTSQPLAQWHKYPFSSGVLHLLMAQWLVNLGRWRRGKERRLPVNSCPCNLYWWGDWHGGELPAVWSLRQSGEFVRHSPSPRSGLDWEDLLNTHARILAHTCSHYEWQGGPGKPMFSRQEQDWIYILRITKQDRDISLIITPQAV